MVEFKRGYTRGQDEHYSVRQKCLKINKIVLINRQLKTLAFQKVRRTSHIDGEINDEKVVRYLSNLFAQNRTKVAS